MSQNESPLGGKVNMSVNTENNIYASNGNLLLLNNGYNNLQRNTNKKVISGILTGYNYCPKNLAAQFNRWNVSNTAPVQGTDYALTNINYYCRPGGVNIYLTDAYPTSGTCGIMSPAQLSGGDNTVEGSSVINSQNYSNTSLSNAVVDAVSYSESGNYFVAADRLYEILSYPLSGTGAADDYYLNKAYLYLKENMGSILENTISDTTLTSQNNLINYSNKLHLIQNKIINQTQKDTAAYNRYFYTSLDKALSYRAVYQYNNAILQLNNILTWVKPANTDEVNKWICLTQLEKDVLDSIVRKEDFFELKQVCENNASSKMASNNSSGNPQNNELPLQINNSDGKSLIQETPFMTVIPNPVKGQSVIEVYAPNFADNAVIKIFDILGKLQMEIPVSETHSSITFSNNSLKEGIYYFILTNNNLVLDKVRVVIIKE